MMVIVAKYSLSIHNVPSSVLKVPLTISHLVLETPCATLLVQIFIRNLYQRKLMYREVK